VSTLCRRGQPVSAVCLYSMVGPVHCLRFGEGTLATWEVMKTAGHSRSAMHVDVQLPKERRLLYMANGLALGAPPGSP